MTETTTARKPYTDTTWAAQVTVKPYVGLGWTAMSDLEHELADLLPNLSVKQAQILLSAAVGQAPVLLTWDTKMGHDLIERTEAMVMVESVTVSGSMRARISYWGFGHDLYLSDVVDVVVPETKRTYRDRD